MTKLESVGLLVAGYIDSLVQEGLVIAPDEFSLTTIRGMSVFDQIKAEGEKPTLYEFLGFAGVYREMYEEILLDHNNDVRNNKGS